MVDAGAAASAESGQHSTDAEGPTKAAEGKWKVQLHRKQGDTRPGVWQEISLDTNDRVIDSFRMEKPPKIIKSNHHPSTANFTAKP